MIHSREPLLGLRDAHLSRVRWFSGITLGFVMAGHMLLETGRDALFLANVSVERLPFVTIGVALLALAFSRAEQGQSHRRVLIGLQATATLGTLAIWALVSARFGWSYYVLYMWSGIVTTLVVVRFWLLLGDLFTISDGKKAFAAIAMGGSIGALLGSVVAAVVAPYLEVGRTLLLLAAGCYAASMLGPILGLPDAGENPSAREVEREPSLGESVRVLVGNPYACRVAALVVLGGVTLTLGDYLFKSVLAAEVAPTELATWLSRIYLGLNLLSIAMLAIGVTPLVRRLGVDRALVVLPSLIGVAALGVLLGGALVATIALKLFDGTLRYSLHKTASELLYLPMTSKLRGSVKAAIDIVAQTGAKALASLMILGLVLAPDERTVVASAVVVSALLWVGMVVRLRRTYLDVFRQTLNEGVIETIVDHPELDLESAGSLVQALSDPDEHRAIAAMRLLVERGQSDLIPSLIVYHPSPRVVTEALDHFAATARADLPHLLGHLIRHEDANVRAASVRAAWVLDHDVEKLKYLLESPCISVRVSAEAGLLACGVLDPEAYRGVLAEALAYDSSEPRLAAAIAAQLHYHPVTRDALLDMASDPDIEVAREAIRAIRHSGDAWFTPHLVDLLGERRIREDVRRALLERGDDALSVLADRMVSSESHYAVLRHIPRTIARFQTPAAVAVLCESLGKVSDGMLRFKLLRGLETLLLTRGEGKGLNVALAGAVDLEPVRDEFRRTLERSKALYLLESRLAAAQAEDPARATVGGELLREMFEDKRALATGRLFMMLGIVFPNEDFGLIHDGLRSSDPNERASAAELLETLLPRDVAKPILRLARAGAARVPEPATDEKRPSEQAGPPEVAERSEKKKSESGAGSGPSIDYDRLIREIVRDSSRTLRAIALYHAGELGIDMSDFRGDSDDPSKPSDLDEEGLLDNLERGLSAVRDLFEGRRAAFAAFAG